MAARRIVVCLPAVVFGAYGTARALVGTGVDLLPLQLYSMPCSLRSIDWC